MHDAKADFAAHESIACQTRHSGAAENALSSTPATRHNHKVIAITHRQPMV